MLAISADWSISSPETIVIPITDCKGKIIEAVGPQTEGEFSHFAQVELP